MEGTNQDLCVADKKLPAADFLPGQATLEPSATSDAALKASEVSYRRLFEAAKDGILILEAATGRISDVNPYLLELLGFSIEELVHKPVWELSPFKDIVSNKEMFEKLQREGYVRYDDLPLETKDGRHIPVEFVSNIYKADGMDVIQCNIRSITERKRLADEIRDLNQSLERRVSNRTSELVAANKDLETFSYTVSHDLRAPLRHIMGFVELLQIDAAPTLSEKSLRYLTMISEAGKRMGELIDDLLVFSHAGITEMNKSDVNLDQVVAEVLEDHSPETIQRKIAWKINPLPHVQGDRSLLESALENLISNAIKFTGHRDRPEIEIGCASDTKEEIVIFIQDNGAGFDPKYVDKLFGVFQRLHGREEFEGTGIGLANVQRIIHRHGGRTWAEGAVDKGAKFYFSLPNPEIRMVVKNKILLIEDDPNDAEMTLMALADFNQTNNVITVPNGKEALDYLYCLEKYQSRRMENPILVLLDLNTPKVGGLEVLKRIKADPQLKIIPVVVLTSSRQPSDVVECYKQGANAYVVKSIDFAEFTKTVNQLGRFWMTVNESPPTLIAKNGEIKNETGVLVERRF